MGLIKEIKYFIQRGKRGYSDRDCWDVNEYMSQVFPAMVRSLKGNGGYPQMAQSHENWDKILEQIAEGFEARYLQDLDYYSGPLAEYELGRMTDEFVKDQAKALKKLEISCELLKTYYNALWS